METKEKITEKELIGKYLRKAKKLIPEYKVSGSIESGIKKFARYLISGREGGVRVSGGVGSGKTTFMKIWSEVLRGTDKYFKIVRCQDIVLEYKEYGDEVIEKYARGITGVGEVRYMFDDFGDEDIISDYGVKVNVMRLIIDKKYWYLKNGVSKKYPHFTSNISDKEICDKYGERISDRIVEISAMLVLNDKSWRGR